MTSSLPSPRNDIPMSRFNTIESTRSRYSATRHGVHTDDDDDENMDDIDSLLKSLKAEDEVKIVVEDKPEESKELSARTQRVPPDMFRTDKTMGLTSAEAEQRLRKFGRNELSENKENLVLKFIMYFTGPIQLVMLVGSRCHLANSPPKWPCSRR
jgi:magnesium-transporting ATPase (P-type)